jgi:hypothetical protein
MEITEASPAPAPMPETTPAPASSQPAPAAPAAALSLATVAAGRGDGKRKRGRPRKYGPDGTPLLRPLNATPISASAPDDAGAGRYTPAAAVGAVMKRGRGRPVGFVSRATPISMAVTAAAPTPAVVVSAPTPALHSPLGPLGTSSSVLSFLPHASCSSILRNLAVRSLQFRSGIGGFFFVWDSGWCETDMLQRCLLLLLVVKKETVPCRSIVGESCCSR